MYQLAYIAPGNRIISAFRESAAIEVTETAPKSPPVFFDDIGVLETTTHTIRVPQALNDIAVAAQDLRPSMRYSQHLLLGSLAHFPTHKRVSAKLFDTQGHLRMELGVVIAAGEQGSFAFDVSHPERVFQTTNRDLFERLSGR
jgi:hypothetical protein